MKVKVSVIKDGKEVASEIVSDPQPGEIGAAASRVLDTARKAIAGPIWDCQVDVRRVP